MLQQERHHQILARLDLDGQVKVKELSDDFHVTRDCIRKDLAILEKAGLLKRIHGGALCSRKNLHHYQVKERKSVHVKEKQIIARKAVELIKPGSMIFLDVSTINLELAKLIYQKDMNIVVVSNMVDIINVFAQGGHTRFLLLGGEFNRSKDGFIGSITIQQIQSYQFDLSFIGVVGIDAYEGKTMTYDVTDGLTKTAIIAASKQSYMVAEKAKLHQDGNYVFADIADFTGLIIESTPEEQILTQLNRSGITIIE